MATQSFETQDGLLAKFQNGDTAAFNELYTQLYPAMCFFATRLVNNNLTAEEIVQDVLFTFWKRKGDFTNFRSAKVFLYVSVRNTALNYLDKQTRKAKKIKAFEWQQPAFDQPFLQEMVLAEVIDELRQEMAKLPEQCAKVIKMLYEDEMKPQQIADELQITVSTVYNQKLRGISLLRKRLPDIALELATVFLILKDFE